MSPAASRSVAFSEVAATSQTRDDSGATIVVGLSDASRRTIERLVPGATAPAGRVMVAAFQGEQTSGGYSIRIERIERNGDQLVVHAKFTEPAPGSMNTMALTSPVHVVSVAAADAAGLREAILIDDSGAERARVAVT